MKSAQSDSEIAAFFDRCAEQNLMTDFPPEERPKLAQFLGQWAIAPGWRVLEPGCGSGRLTAELAAAVGPEGEVYACDLSEGMLDLARRRAMPAQARLIRGSALRIERPDGWFDCVVCLSVFPHFAQPSEALREFARALRPGGRLWINHFEGRRGLNRFHAEAAPEVHDHALPCPYSMGRLMTEAGFEVESLDDREEHYILQAVRVSA